MMSKPNVFPAYIGTMIFCCMLLMGHHAWPQTCVDLDMDGYGNPESTSCPHPEWDCDDTNPLVNPGAQEGPFGDPSCSDTLDNDCDWSMDTEDSACCECIDNDSDGYGDPGCENCAYPEWDCDDTQPNVNPAVQEDCANGIDDDCDGYKDGNDGDCPCIDDDGDGYGVFWNPNCSYWGSDCDDTNPQVNPGVREGPFGDPSCSDGLNNDCDWGTDSEDSGCCECIDNDGDGYGYPGCENCTYSWGDCDDTQPNVNPGVPEDCTNGIDDDCDGLADEEDGECPLLAVMDDRIGENSTVVSVLLQIGGETFEIQETLDFSGKALVYYQQSTGYLWILPLLVTANTVDFSVPVWLWKLTGTIEDLELKTYVGNIMWPGGFVDPSDGSFRIYLNEIYVRYVISAYFAGKPIAEDVEVYTGWYDTSEISGTLLEVGDNDGDGLNEYEMTLHGQISVSMPMGEIPLIGETSITISGELDLGFVGETLCPDSYEPDNFPDDGKSLLPGMVQSHVIHPIGDVDWIKVSVLEGREYTVETLNLAYSWSDSDTVLEVYDDTGSLITENDDVDYNNGRLESRVSWTATYTGTYYVKVRTSDGISGHFDDQGGGEEFCSYDISFSCSDLDGDGYGDPGSLLCTYSEADCDDTNPNVNPEVLEGLPWNPKCHDGLDNDCDGLIDGADTGCQYSGVANAEASSYGTSSLIASGSFNSLALFLIPMGALVLLRIGSRKNEPHI